MKARHLSDVDMLVIHHSAGPLSQTLEDIRRIHVEQNGWEDVGYHFVLEADGTIRRGRPLDVEGAHCRGHNDHTIGICVVGDNTQLSRQWTPMQRASLRALVVSLRSVLGPLDIRRHRDLGATLCPGLDDHAWAPVLADLLA